MPPKVVAVKPMTLDFESRVDEKVKLVRSFVELKSGFGEDHVKSRTMQGILKQFDIDHTNEITADEFARALDYMNIQCTVDERLAIFGRFDTERVGKVSFKDFSDAIFGLKPAPCGNPEARSVIKKLKDKMIQRAGDEGVRGLTRALFVMDQNKSGTLSKEEIFNGLQRYGIQCALADADIILKHFDTDGSGAVTLTEFVRALRGHMPVHRRELVEKAFVTFANGDEAISVADVARAYDVSQHPAVLNGQKTQEQVLRDFMASWTEKGADGSITKDEWIDYYEDISAGIENDAYFELMFRNAWHITGGTGSAANTSCRRVLVTYKDGHQTIEEIQNDLRIGPKDIEKMKAALEHQGVKDIVKIEMYA